MSTPEPDHEWAAREQNARQHLMDAGASSLPSPPWLHESQPFSSIDLVWFAVWRGQTGVINDDDTEAALTLLGAARSEIDVTCHRDGTGVLP